MSLWVQAQFAGRVGSRLRNFRQIKPQLWNFSCPICGDSKKNARKSRGYFYESKQQINYRCHNCGAGMSLGSFLKLIDHSLYDEYKLEMYKESNAKKSAIDDDTAEEIEKELKAQPNALRDMRCIDKMPEDHPAVQYVAGRMIPKNRWKDLFYVPKYFKWISKIDPESMDPDAKETEYKLKHDHPRLIIPYFDKDGKIFRLTARAFGKESPKYLFTVIDDSKPSLYNFDSIDLDETVYVVEGPIDSLFLPNSIAVGNANYGVPALKKIRNKVIVPDNQPRNAEVVKNIKDAIDMGYSVCIWDKDYGKDINQIVQNGYSPEEVKHIIDRCTVCGATAQLAFAKWKRS